VDDRQLLFRVTRKDLIETHIRGTGNGGQARNKTSSGVRLVHPASGAVGESTASRSQEENRVEAWKHLRKTPEFERWFRDMVLRTSGLETPGERVGRLMAPENITTQVLDERSRWVNVDPTDLS
jgi:hypothetical protein